MTEGSKVKSSVTAMVGEPVDSSPVDIVVWSMVGCIVISADPPSGENVGDKVPPPPVAAFLVLDTDGAGVAVVVG